MGFRQCVVINALKGLTRTTSEAMKIAHEKHPENFKLSEKTKNKLRDFQLARSKRGEHSGWSFINKDINRRSYPEKYFVKFFELEKIFDKYDIREKFNVGKYFLDFAIIDLKLDIEIDGQQHYRCNENIEHDLKRDCYLKSLGWKVYRICWANVCKNSLQEKQELLTFIDNIDSKQDRHYNIKDFKTHQEKIQENRQKRFQENRQKRFQEKNKSIQEKIDIIKNCNIDFSKLGWVDKISKNLNMRQQKISSWMKSYMPEFYENNCFKRKTPPVAE